MMLVTWKSLVLAVHFKPHSLGRRFASGACFACRIESFENIDGGDEREGVVTQWWHLSGIAWSPVWPVYTEMRLLDEDIDASRVTLEDTGNHMATASAFMQLSKGRKWESTWYILEASEKVLTSLHPHVVTAVPWGDETPIGFLASPQGDPQAQREAS